ncbi:MAG: hypothetical protein QXP01_03325 [Candidatus Hadarchaeum sp.]
MQRAILWACLEANEAVSGNARQRTIRRVLPGKEITVLRPEAQDGDLW